MGLQTVASNYVYVIVVCVDNPHEYGASFVNFFVNFFRQTICKLQANPIETFKMFISTQQIFFHNVGLHTDIFNSTKLYSMIALYFADFQGDKYFGFGAFIARFPDVPSSSTVSFCVFDILWISCSFAATTILTHSPFMPHALHIFADVCARKEYIFEVAINATTLVLTDVATRVTWLVSCPYLLCPFSILRFCSKKDMNELLVSSLISLYSHRILKFITQKSLQAAKYLSRGGLQFFFCFYHEVKLWNLLVFAQTITVFFCSFGITICVFKLSRLCFPYRRRNLYEFLLAVFLPIANLTALPF